MWSTDSRESCGRETGFYSCIFLVSKKSGGSSYRYKYSVRWGCVSWFHLMSQLNICVHQFISLLDILNSLTDAIPLVIFICGPFRCIYFYAGVRHLATSRVLLCFHGQFRITFCDGLLNSMFWCVFHYHMHPAQVGVLRSLVIPLQECVPWSVRTVCLQSDHPCGFVHYPPKWIIFYICVPSSPVDALFLDLSKFPGYTFPLFALLPWIWTIGISSSHSASDCTNLVYSVSTGFHFFYIGFSGIFFVSPFIQICCLCAGWGSIHVWSISIFMPVGCSLSDRGFSAGVTQCISVTHRESS